MAYIGRSPVIGSFRKIDDITSQFNGAQTVFTLLSNGGGVDPGTSQNLLVSLGGVIQEPVTAYTVSGSTITFASPPANTQTFFAVLLGDALDVGNLTQGVSIDVTNINAAGTLDVTSNATFTGRVNVTSQLMVTANTTLGSDVLRVDTVNNRVAIGSAATPNTRVVVFGGSTFADTQAQFRRSTLSGQIVVEQALGLGAARETSNCPWVGSISSGINPQDFALVVNDVEQARLRVGGNFGLGNTAPDHRLRVDGTTSLNGAVNVLSTLSVTGDVTLRSNTTRLADTTTPWISTVRTLQIGPRLAVYDTGSTAAFMYNGYINTAGTLVYTQTAAASLYDTAVGLHRWYTAPSGTAGTPITFTEVMSLVANGNLGIGNTAPAHKLRVEGAISSSQGIRVTTAGTLIDGFYDFLNGGTWDVVGYRGSANLVIGGYRSSQWSAVEVFTAGASRLVVDGNGNVGIGTSSILGRFTVANGYAYVTDDGTRRLIMGPDSTGTLVGTTTNHYLRFITNDTERVMIAANGNVGFGTSSPANRVHIRGTGAGIGAGNEILRIDTSNGDERLQFGVDDTNDFGWIRAVKAGSELPLWLGATGGAIVAGAAAAQTSFAITTGVWGSGTSGNRGVFASGMVLGATGGDYGVVGYNARFNSSGTFTYAVADTSSLIYFGSGFTFRYAGTGTVGNTITHTNIARMDSAGNFVVGNDTTYSGTGVTSIKIQATSYPTLALYQGATNIGLLWTATDVMLSAMGSRGIQFQTNDVTRMTVTADGNVLVGASSSATDSDNGAKLYGSGRIASVADSGVSDTWTYYNLTAGAYRFYVSSAGTVFATSTTISAISDQRLKENIRDLDVGLDAIMALRPRSFDWKSGKGKDIKNDRGFIAQEFEQVFPDLVDEWKDVTPEDEEPYKSVRPDLIPVLVKAIQELTARVAVLERRGK